MINQLVEVEAHVDLALLAPNYHAMVRAIEDCLTIDDAKLIADKAAALAVYCRQRDDRENDVMLSEIRHRADIRAGELSRELEKGHKVGQGSDVQLPAGRKLKAEVLAAVGISKSTAHELERLTGGDDPAAQAAARQAHANVFELAREEKKPATRAQLQNAVDRAVAEVVTLQPRKAESSEEHRRSTRLLGQFLAGIDYLGNRENLSGTELARLSFKGNRGSNLEAAKRARGLLDDYIAAMERGPAHA